MSYFRLVQFYGILCPFFDIIEENSTLKWRQHPSGLDDLNCALTNIITDLNLFPLNCREILHTPRGNLKMLFNQKRLILVCYTIKFCL